MPLFTLSKVVTWHIVWNCHTPGGNLYHNGYTIILLQELYTHVQLQKWTYCSLVHNLKYRPFCSHEETLINHEHCHLFFVFNKGFDNGGKLCGKQLFLTLHIHTYLIHLHLWTAKIYFDFFFYHILSAINYNHLQQ